MLEALLDAYCSYLRKKSMRQESGAAYSRNIMRMLGAFLDPTKSPLSYEALVGCTPADVRRFLEGRAASGVSANVLQKYRSEFSLAFDYFRSIGVVASNPVDDSVPCHLGTRTREDYLSKAEVNALFDLVVTSVSPLWLSARNDVIFKLYYRHGLSPKIVGSISLGMVDGATIKLPNHRTLSVRVVHLDDELHSSLKLYLTTMPVAVGPADGLFRGRNSSEAVNIAAMNDRWQLAAKAAGLRYSARLLSRSGNRGAGLDLESAPPFGTMEAPSIRLARLARFFRSVHPRWES